MVIPPLQRVKRFHIEVLEKGKWKTINSGTAIGHKYIYLSDQDISTSKIRVIVDESFAEPYYLSFSTYHVNTL